MAVAADAPPPWLRGEPGDWRVSLWIQPGAARTESVGEHDGCLKLRIAAPPIDGRANEAIRRFVAERLGLAPGAVRIGQGESSRRKRVHIASGLDAHALRTALGDPGPRPGPAHQGDAP